MLVTAKGKKHNPLSNQFYKIIFDSVKINEISSLKYYLSLYRKKIDGNCCYLLICLLFAILRFQWQFNKKLFQGQGRVLKISYSENPWLSFLIIVESINLDISIHLIRDSEQSFLPGGSGSFKYGSTWKFKKYKSDTFINNNFRISEKSFKKCAIDQGFVLCFTPGSDSLDFSMRLFVLKSREIIIFRLR